MEQMLAFALGYLFGSIPFGLLLGFALGKGDIRNIGSGSIGATNALRTGSKVLALGTLLLDLVKGYLPVFLASRWLPESVGLVALAAVIGHCFTVWLRFKGGKGIATGAGVLLALGWPLFAAALGAWAVMFLITRISSVGGISAAIAAPIAAWFFGYQHLFGWVLAIAVVILWQHRSNIARLRSGEEPKVGAKK